MAIICVDFDGTIAKWAKYPNIGTLVPYSKDVINRLHASGHEIIIWTCRGPNGVSNVTQWLNDNEVKFHSINRQNFDTSFDPSPKVIADLYIDDKSAMCPLTFDSVPYDPATQWSGTVKAYVDWLVLEYWLKENGYYTISLGA